VDRVFLDANVLFSAAWRAGAALERLWRLDGVELLRSANAVEEARRNLETPAKRRRLSRLLRRVRLVVPRQLPAPRGVHLPRRDLPILLAAIEGKATHLVTGDWEHFGPYFRQEFAGVLILPPAAYPALAAEA
jgi:predicted nucleic acid-binding protein